jgi:hypothetical protein
MKLNIWNWMQLLLTFCITGIAVFKYENPFWMSLGFSLFFSFILWAAIVNAVRGQRDVKTGRSFRTDYGIAHEMKKESYNNYETSNYSDKIAIFHISCVILIIIKSIYTTLN